VSCTTREPIEIARVGVDQRVDRHHLSLDRRRRGDDLERRARLVEILHGAVAALGLVESRYAFGLNVGSFAIARISPVCGFMMMALPPARGSRARRVQLALGDVLQVLVDRQLDVEPDVGGRSKRLKAWRRASVWMRIVPALPRICES
jgi:hypothetical protein